MSNYLHEKLGGIAYKKNNEDKIFKSIVREARNKKWDCYGWSSEVRKAKNIEEIFEVFGLKIDTIWENEIVVHVNHTYYSDFLRYMLSASINYLEDSTIIINTDENDVIKVTVKDHKLES